jgi:hypothetical protein
VRTRWRRPTTGRSSRTRSSDDSRVTCGWGTVARTVPFLPYFPDRQPRGRT